MRTKPFAIIAVCAASSVGWQRTTRWMALRRELCVSRKGYSGQISLKPSFPGRLEPTATAICVARGLPGRQIEVGMIYLPASRKLPFGSYCRICSEPRV